MSYMNPPDEKKHRNRITGKPLPPQSRDEAKYLCDTIAKHIKKIGIRKFNRSYHEGTNNAAAYNLRRTPPATIKELWMCGCAIGDAGGDVYGLDILQAAANVKAEIIAICSLFLEECAPTLSLLSRKDRFDVLMGVSMSIRAALEDRDVPEQWRLGPMVKAHSIVKMAMNRAFERWEKSPTASELSRYAGAAHAILAATGDGPLAAQILLADGYNHGIPKDVFEIIQVDESELGPYL